MVQFHILGMVGGGEGGRSGGGEMGNVVETGGSGVRVDVFVKEEGDMHEIYRWAAIMKGLLQH